jgi:hypothetical protein
MKCYKSLSLIIALATFVSLNVQAKNGLYFSHRKSAQSMSAAQVPLVAPVNNLNYYGGPVISHAHVYVVYWGNNVRPETQAKIGKFYKTVLKSTYMDWLTEYNSNLTALDGRAGTKQKIGRGEYEDSFTINPFDTRVNIDDVDIQAELAKQVSAGVLPKGNNKNLFMIYFPPGMTITAAGATSCKEFCAYHGFSGAPETPHTYYGVMPDISGDCFKGCAYSPKYFDALTSISSHELIEAITDPFPTPGDKPSYPQAWNDSKGAEIGDLCQKDTNVVSEHESFVVQTLWDNKTNACTTSDWKADD